MEIIVKSLQLRFFTISVFFILFSSALFCDDDAQALKSGDEVIKQALAYLSAGSQEKAEQLIDDYCIIFPNHQKLFFYAAACTRSRFMIEEAYFKLKKVYYMNEKTVYAKCAALIIALDNNNEIEKNFALLEKLVAENPDEIMLRWMLAVECRNLGYDEKGAQQYAIILKNWNPGPVLLHQTYANILDNLEKYEESLVHRKLAVELEPCGWSYHGLSVTLYRLKRYAEAREAVLLAIECEPETKKYRNFLEMINQAVKDQK
jgi:tetratricopeptide (TPR) repeat protein